MKRTVLLSFIIITLNAISQIGMDDYSVENFQITTSTYEIVKWDNNENSRDLIDVETTIIYSNERKVLTISNTNKELIFYILYANFDWGNQTTFSTTNVAEIIYSDGMNISLTYDEDPDTQYLYSGF